MHHVRGVKAIEFGTHGRQWQKRRGLSRDDRWAAPGAATARVDGTSLQVFVLNMLRKMVLVAVNEGGKTRSNDVGPSTNGSPRDSLALPGGANRVVVIPCHECHVKYCTAFEASSAQLRRGCCALCSRRRRERGCGGGYDC